ncbi:pentapeptide repeat-containing protein [Streptomyces sp. NPDC001661]
MLLPWLLWRGPYVLDAKYLDRAKLADGSAALVTGLRTALVGLAAALGAGVALLYTARTYRLSHRGQITDRFTKALERLGSPDIYVRVGGVLALEQIVQDAPEQAATDAARVLGHFIRQRTPRTRSSPAHADEETLPDQPDADVQAALTALTRPEPRKYVDFREEIDLRDLHLAGADFRWADLTECDMEGVNLAGANLFRANLTGACLTSANLTKAWLTRVEAPLVLLHEADLSDASLDGALLVQAGLCDARLTRASLKDVKLLGADLRGAFLKKADLRRAWLTGADLAGAILAGANLHDVRGLTAQQMASVATDEM